MTTVRASNLLPHKGLRFSLPGAATLGHTVIVTVEPVTVCVEATKLVPVMVYVAAVIVSR